MAVIAAYSRLIPIQKETTNIDLIRRFDLDVTASLRTRAIQFASHGMTCIKGKVAVIEDKVVR